MNNTAITTPYENRTLEACCSGKIDDEGADVGPVTGRSPGAQDVEDVEVFVQTVDHVLLDDLVGRGLWRGSGHEVQIMDMAGSDGVEDEALPQVIGVIELALPDAGAGLENGEPCFDAPATLVEGDDLACLFGRRLALGGEQQPVEALLVVWWGNFGGRDREHPGGCLVRGVGRCRQGDGAGPQVQFGLALLAAARTSAGVDGNRLAGERRLSRNMVPQVLEAAVGGDDAAAARPVGAHQQTCARGHGLADQCPDVTLTVTNRDHAGFATGGRQFSGALEAFQPTAAFLARPPVRRDGSRHQARTHPKAGLDCGVPLSAILTSASVHDSQVAIPLVTMTAERVVNLYDVMDAAYDAREIHATSKRLGHVAIIDVNPRRDSVLKKARKQEARARRAAGMVEAQSVRYRIRTAVERTNARLKDEFGGRHVRVRGPTKVICYLMFGLLALTADQLMRLAVP